MRGTLDGDSMVIMNQYLFVQNQGSFVCRYPIESEGEKVSTVPGRDQGSVPSSSNFGAHTRLSLMPPFTCAPFCVV